MRVLIVGASARAAAGSAARAGLVPLGIDLFGDRDLRALGPAITIEPSEYPEGLERLAGASPPGPWMYTGGIENHPDLVDRIAARRTLWGNPGAVLRRVRDPAALVEVLARADLPHARVWGSPRGLPRDGSILVKPVASAGGRAIRVLAQGEDEPAEPVYYQERLEGPSLGAVFVAGREGGPTVLAGLTQHLPGEGFAWCGCVGPIEAGLEATRGLERLGATLAEEFGLAGLFGVDLVEHRGALVPVEVNPRYTASVEVLEWALGRALLAEHRAAFEGGTGRGGIERSTVRNYVGKWIMTAPVPVRAPALDGWRPVGDDGGMPRIADVPAEGTRIGAGEPVLTLLESATSPEACRARLARRRAGWEARLRRPPWAEAGGGAR